MELIRTRRTVALNAALLVAAALAFGQNRRATGTDAQWWKHAVLYEIYPRSFGDTNGDGIGDLNGITAHLDYLKDLGVDGVWITPFYPSPQVDFGYDISDYRAIDPQYGTMADFERLVAEASKRNIRVITDLVLNHTSDQHAWFKESSSSRANPKAGWYVWRDGRPNRRPPNNWLSIFGGSAWQYVPTRNQFYYHAFYKEQPDLNWRDREVRNAMYDVMRFWMKRGSAGFRLDAITSLFEDPQFRDESYLPGTTPFGDRRVSREYSDNLPEIHDVLREVRKVTDEFPGRVLIGENYLPNVGELAKMYGKNHDELQLPMDLQYGFINQLSAPLFREKLREAETQLNGNMPLLVFDNHDNRRSWNRYADGKHDAAIAKLVATLLLAPRGTALLYYGQEIGMPNNDPKSKAEVRDPIGIIGWPKEIGRDGERTPMQWSAAPNAGFSNGAKTWLPVGPDYRTRNVAVESKDPNSMLNYYKALIRLRRQNSAMRDGALELIDEQNPNVLAFLRRSGAAVLLVAMNFTDAPQAAPYDLASKGVRGTKLRKLLSSFQGPGPSDVSAVKLPAYGAYIGAVE
jgi:alpha-glucosidase